MMEKSVRAGVGRGCTPTPFHSIYHHVHSCCVYSIWEGRYTPPISPLPLCVLNSRCCDQKGCWQKFLAQTFCYADLCQGDEDMNDNILLGLRKFKIWRPWEWCQCLVHLSRQCTVLFDDCGLNPIKFFSSLLFQTLCYCPFYTEELATGGHSCPVPVQALYRSGTISCLLVLLR